MHQQDIHVLRAEVLAQAVDGSFDIFLVAQPVLRHQTIAVARDALQRRRKHLGHPPVRIGRFEKPDAAVVRVADQASELLLSELSLDLSAHRPGPECETRYLDARVA
jgi:hypothetical protein